MDFKEDEKGGASQRDFGPTNFFGGVEKKKAGLLPMSKARSYAEGVPVHGCKWSSGYSRDDTSVGQGKWGGEGGKGGGGWRRKGSG